MFSGPGTGLPAPRYHLTRSRPAVEMPGMRIGIDLGGTKIEGIALGPDGAALARRRIPSPAQDGYEAVLDAIAGLVAGLEAATGRRGTVGVGIPGAISPATGLVKNANSTCLIGHPLDRDLGDRLDRPVRLENDANCFALSEATDGAGRGAGVVFGVILGTGVGGGLVVHGQPLRGATAIAGEWGHNPLPWPGDAERPGPACYCGRRACVETFLSGPGLARDHGGSGDAHAVVAAAEAGDGPAMATLGRWLDRLARSLATVINIVDPDVIVLGGGLSNVDSTYVQLPALLPRYVFSDVVATPVVKAMHGDSSGVRGAAWLWPS